MTPALAVLGAGAWAAWVAGPLSMALQLAACIALAALAARRSGRNLVVWLFVGCVAAVVPLAGVLGMAAAAVVVKAPRAQA
jgi:uncharacterized membrane protein